MKKIVVVTEGQSEQILIRRFLLLSFSNEKLSFECLKLYGGRQESVRYKYNPPNAEIYFLILNLTGDESVISAIRERGKKWIESGFEHIIGIRDMYCEEYFKRSPEVIDEALNDIFIEKSLQVIREINIINHTTIIYSIMELEAWLVAMYNLFQKVNDKLTFKRIQNEIKYNFRSMDPQKEIYRPYNLLSIIFMMVGIKYEKSYDFQEMLASKMELYDFDNAVENGRCSNFKLLQDKIKSFKCE